MACSQDQLRHQCDMPVCRKSRWLTFVLLGLMLAAWLLSPDSSGHAFAPQEATSANLKIAFIGDQALGPNSVAVLNLIKSEGAEAVMHSGDLDYTDNPTAWE